MKWVSFVLTPHRVQSIWPISWLSLFGLCLTNPFSQAFCTVSPWPPEVSLIDCLAWLWWGHCCIAAFHKWAPCSGYEWRRLFGWACWDRCWCPTTSVDHFPPCWCRNQSARAFKAQAFINQHLLFLPRTAQNRRWDMMGFLLSCIPCLTIIIMRLIRVFRPGSCWASVVEPAAPPRSRQNIQTACAPTDKSFFICFRNINEHTAGSQRCKYCVVWRDECCLSALCQSALSGSAYRENPVFFTIQTSKLMNRLK